MADIQDIITKLDLLPHPEGGFYRRTYENNFGTSDRGYASAIYYLLEGGKFNKWHRFDADELWFWHAGAPLTLEINTTNKKVETSILGSKVLLGELPQMLVPANKWQRAQSNGEWTLVSCSVSPGFSFENYELIEDSGWHPCQP